MRKAKNQNSIKGIGRSTIQSSGVEVQEAGAMHQAGTGFPCRENSAPTVIYNCTVSVS